MLDQPMNPYHDIYTQLAGDGAFLWQLRSSALTQPNYHQSDLFELEQRIDAQLDGLMTAPDDAWEICDEALELQQSGEVFAAAVVCCVLSPGDGEGALVGFAAGPAAGSHD